MPALPLALIMCLWGCSGSGDTKFASPAVTYATYVAAVLDADPEVVWQCFGDSYRSSEYGGDIGAWKEEWQTSRGELIRQARLREIADERLIGDRVGYLLFDATTLSSPQQSPFFYFIREPEGWKITSFLDSTFHAELEASIGRGEFKVEQW